MCPKNGMVQVDPDFHWSGRAQPTPPIRGKPARGIRPRPLGIQVKACSAGVSQQEIFQTQVQTGGIAILGGKPRGADCFAAATKTRDPCAVNDLVPFIEDQDISHVAITERGIELGTIVREYPVLMARYVVVVKNLGHFMAQDRVVVTPICLNGVSVAEVSSFKPNPVIGHPDRHQVIF